MRYLLLGCLLLLAPYTVEAAYQNPTKVSEQILPDGSTQVTLQFRGNAREPTVERVLRLEVGMTAADVRRWVGRELARLDGQHAIKEAVAALNGPIPPLPTPAVTTPAPTAKEVWRKKYQAYITHKDAGLGGQVALDLDALKLDLENTYQKGFLNE